MKLLLSILMLPLITVTTYAQNGQVSIDVGKGTQQLVDWSHMTTDKGGLEAAVPDLLTSLKSIAQVLDKAGSSELRGDLPRELITVMKSNVQGELLSVKGNTMTLKCWATKSSKESTLIMMNLSPDSDELVDLSGVSLSSATRALRYSNLEYYWSDVDQRVAWSYPATELAVSTRDNKVLVPALSFLILSPAQEVPLEQVEVEVDVEIALTTPARGVAGSTIRGFVSVGNIDKRRPYEGAVSLALETDNGEISPRILLFDRGVAEFEIRNTKAGQANVSLSGCDQKVEARLEIQP